MDYCLLGNAAYVSRTSGFALGNTVYILIAIRFEEKDLVNLLGEAYENYHHQVSMLLPMKWRR